MTAIVTDVHYRMSLAIIRDLADAGVSVIACDYADIQKPAGFFSNRIAGRVPLAREGYADGLFALCKQTMEQDGQKPALIPVGAKTLALVSQQRERFAGVSGLLVPKEQDLALLNDKECVANLAQALGIPVPRAYAGAARPVQFPAVVKPVCGEKAGLSAAERYVIARDAQQLERAVAHFTGVTGQRPLIQEYLCGGAAGCSVLAREGKVLASICHERIREYPVSGGPSSCCRKIDAPELLQYAQKITASLGYSGVAMFEFKQGADGAYRLLEVNPRVWGTYPLTRVCGSNFTWLWCLAALGLPLPDFQSGSAAKMAYYPSDLAAMLGYLKRGEAGRFLRGLADFFDPRVKNGLREKGDGKPYRVYLKSLLERGSR